LDDLHRVVPDQAHIGQFELGDTLQQAAYAGSVHLHADEIGVGPRLRNRRGGLAHAESDLQHPRRVTTEQRVEIGRVVRNGTP